MQPQFTPPLLTSVYMATFNDRLRDLCGTTILPAHLAKVCRVSRTAAGKWFERGDIKARHIFALADFLNVEGRWLALGEGPKHAMNADPAAQRLWKHWSRIDDFTKGEIVRLAIERALPPGPAPPQSKRA